MVPALDLLETDLLIAHHMPVEIAGKLVKLVKAVPVAREGSLQNPEMSLRSDALIALIAVDDMVDMAE